jgi:hypothetical protein
MLDLENEKALTLNEARRLPFVKGRAGNRVSLCTMNRWRTRGVGGVVLETAKVGGTVVTTIEAVLRFVERLSTHEHTTRDPTPAARRQSVTRADKRLDDVGIA